MPAGLTNVVAVAAGKYHSLALKNDGIVVAWGENDFGETTVPAGLINVVGVAAGDYHSLALKSDGTVVAWGENDFGETTVPAGLTNVVAVAAGGIHSLALKSDGTVVAWGNNYYGETTVPAGLTNVVAIAAGDFHSLALKSDGTVVAWGDNYNGQTTVPAGLTTVVAIAAGGYHSLALKSDGTVVAWGNNYYGETTVPAGLTNVVAIAAGGYHSLALKSDGTVVAWGWNSNGQMSVPSRLTNVVAIAAGYEHSLALPQTVDTLMAVSLPSESVMEGTIATPPRVKVTDAFGHPVSGAVVRFTAPSGGASGTFAGGATTALSVTNAAGIALAPKFTANATAGRYALTTTVAGIAAPVTFTLSNVAPSTPVAWGDNYLGQTNVPVGLTNVVAVAARGYHSLALKSDGTVVAWGSNFYGETTVPAGLTNVVAIAAGELHSLALKSDGTVVAWGNNYFGQTRVPTNLANVVAVAAGNSYSLALKSDGTVVAWGNNGNGEGNVPAGLANVVAVAAGDFHGLALKSDGTVVAWGSNLYGQTSVPAGLGNVVAIAGGREHSLALKSDGTVVAWGDNEYGQTSVPAGLASVVAIAAGGDDSLALKSDGTVVAWGLNSVGQTTVPAGLTNVVAIAPGGVHNLALTAVSLVRSTVSAQPASVVAGATATLTLQLRDSQGNALTHGGAIVTFGLGSGTSSGTIGPISDHHDGTYSATFTATTAGTPRTITAAINSQAVTSILPTITVTPAAANHFQVSCPAAVTAGFSFACTLTAKDSYGNTDINYRGTVNFTSTDGRAMLPANYPFTSGDQGGHPFAVTLRTLSSQTITVTDTVQPSITGSATVTVNQYVLTVTNAQDSGPGSLRQAILDSNANPGSGLNKINFAIGTGMQIINLISAFPTITNPVVIDGITQPGYAGRPLIELNGAGAGGSASGLVITAGNSTAKGLVINRFSNNGIELRGLGGDIVQGNYIGTDVTGTHASGNGKSNGPITAGIYINGSPNNTIGGLTAAARNLVSGNLADGVFLSDNGTSGNQVQGNYIGTDYTGTVALSNDRDGVEIFASASNNLIGGTMASARNVISGNRYGGISIDQRSAGNQVQGNYIGTNATGTADLGNTFGVAISGGASNNLIGGTVAGARNLISGNFPAYGIAIYNSGTTGNQVQGNYIGTDVTGAIALGNAIGLAIYDAVSTNTIGGTVAGARNLISGNFPDEGIYIADRGTSGNQVQGNYIGTDASGTRSLANSVGVYIEDAASTNTIGGAAAGAGNLISGNAGSGVSIYNASGNQVLGNYIGTEVSGRFRLPNSDGLFIEATGNTIGGTTTGSRNVISGNNGNGIRLASSSNLVQGNLIGTDATGNFALGNSANGILIGSPSGAGSTIGGTTPAARNVISGNRDAGVRIESSRANNQIQGNYIGTDIGGMAALGNGYGVYITGISNNTTVGGTVAGAGNVISGNSTGVAILADANQVQGNYIGTDASGSTSVSNLDGIDILAGSNNTIGGTTAGARNVISGNLNFGVGIFASRNLVQGNYIGTKATGTAGLGNDTGLYISGSANTVGGTVNGAGNIISGNGNNGVELFEAGARDNVLQGNRIGTNAAGTGRLGNAIGVFMENAPSNTIGGTATGAGNVISANSAGVRIDASGTTGTVVQGNYVGTDITGKISLGNGDGIHISDGAAGNTIGGTLAGAENVIANSNSDGLRVLGGANSIQGNIIRNNGSRFVRGAGGGMFVAGSNNTIGGTAQGAGNIIVNNYNYGIEIAGGSTGNMVLGNYIGTDANSAPGLGNRGDGVWLTGGAMNNTIGGTYPGAGNVISGNQDNGILIAPLCFRGCTPPAVHNLVLSNKIGTDVPGLRALPNGIGISISDSSFNTIGGTTSTAGNLISGNQNAGIAINGSDGNLVQGNYLGTNVNGTSALGNGTGVAIGSTGSSNRNQIGGSQAGSRNVISGNRGDGIALNPYSYSSSVQGNFIGTDATGRVALGNGGDGIVARGFANTEVSGDLTGNIISGNSGNGIALLGDLVLGTTVRGNFIGTDVSGTVPLPNATGVVILGGGSDRIESNVIAGNRADGVMLNAAFTSVEGNFIGTNAASTPGLGNGADGVEVDGPRSGLGVSIDDNTIVANHGIGIRLDSLATAILVTGNYIGTDARSTPGLGNGRAGVLVVGDRVTIGGTTATAANVIAGNTDHGVVLTSHPDNLVLGNYIGTDRNGTPGLGNGGNGVWMDGSNSSTVGGTAPGAANVIAGNQGDGVLIDSRAANNLVLGNFVCTDANGDYLANGSDGVAILGGANSNTIGGTDPGAANVIGMNAGNGVTIADAATTGNLVFGNFVGTDANGDYLANGNNGVAIVIASNNTVAANIIANSGNDGVLIDTGTGNLLSQNAISSSGNLGIELLNGGNNNQAFPVLTSATTDGSSTTVAGTLTSAPNTTYTLEFFYNSVCNPSSFGEGANWLGSSQVSTDDTGMAAFSIPFDVAVDPSQWITATATDSANNTSSFSQCLPVSMGGGSMTPGSVRVGPPRGKGLGSAVHASTEKLYWGRIINVAPCSVRQSVATADLQAAGLVADEPFIPGHRPTYWDLPEPLEWLDPMVLDLLAANRLR